MSCKASANFSLYLLGHHHVAIKNQRRLVSFLDLWTLAQASHGKASLLCTWNARMKAAFQLFSDSANSSESHCTFLLLHFNLYLTLILACLLICSEWRIGILSH